jgi:hypothetical protein
VLCIIFEGGLVWLMWLAHWWVWIVSGVSVLVGVVVNVLIALLMTLLIALVIH